MDTETIMEDEKDVTMEEAMAGINLEADAVEDSDEMMVDEAALAALSQTGVLEEGEAVDLAAVYDVPVDISVVLGTTNISISQLLRMGSGAVLELQRKVGEAVDVYVNNRLIARGEVVIVEENIGVTLTEIIKHDN